MRLSALSLKIQVFETLPMDKSGFFLMRTSSLFCAQMIKLEMMLFDTSVKQERPPDLDRIYRALVTLPLLSEEAARFIQPDFL